MASRKAARSQAPAADVEVVEKTGFGIDEGIVFGTFFLLVAAIVWLWMANQKYTPGG